MTAIIAALMGFIILSCFANTKSLIAIIGLAALFYVSLAAQHFFCKNFQAIPSGWKSQSFRLR